MPTRCSGADQRTETGCSCTMKAATGQTGTDSRVAAKQLVLDYLAHLLELNVQLRTSVQNRVANYLVILVGLFSAGLALVTLWFTTFAGKACLPVSIGIFLLFALLTVLCGHCLWRVVKDILGAASFRIPGVNSAGIRSLSEQPSASEDEVLAGLIENHLCGFRILWPAFSRYSDRSERRRARLARGCEEFKSVALLSGGRSCGGGVCDRNCRGAR
jgi:hypothetical protein